MFLLRTKDYCEGEEALRRHILRSVQKGYLEDLAFLVVEGAMTKLVIPGLNLKLYTEFFKERVKKP